MSRRSQRLALQDPALHVLAPLFPELASAIFAQLPVDSRLRCREVCRGWRAFLADARHWQVLDLSLSSGVARRSLAMLRSASERARGTLRELDVSGWYNMAAAEGEEELEYEQLLAVLRANAASLLELRAWKPVDSEGETVTSTEGVEELLSSAPRLRLLECDVSLCGEDARGTVPRLLHEPQFSPLRLQMLDIDAERARLPLALPELIAHAARHTDLRFLRLNYISLDNEPELDAVIELAILQLHRLDLYGCGLSPASLPALTRMLGSRSLVQLLICNSDEAIFAGLDVPAFCAALRDSRLRKVDLCVMRLWESLEDGLAVISACTGHATLRELDFQYNSLDVPGSAVIEAALDAMKASTPGLRLTL